VQTLLAENFPPNLERLLANIGLTPDERERARQLALGNTNPPYRSLASLVGDPNLVATFKGVRQRLAAFRAAHP
jgi:hypothetical protein